MVLGRPFDPHYNQFPLVVHFIALEWTYSSYHSQPNLTKWPEAFAIPHQKAETIARLFVEHIVCRHGIPEELLSDRGANFLSALIQDICRLLGVKKINTSGYHPQTDGLVERFNSTLINMIAKSCDVKDRDWDDHLPYLLFAYRVSAQESTRESPFFLLYGRDARTPTSTVLFYARSPYAVDIDDFKADMLSELSKHGLRPQVTLPMPKCPRRSTMIATPRVPTFVLAIGSWCICLLRFKERTGNSCDLSTAPTECCLSPRSSTGGLSDR